MSKNFFILCLVLAFVFPAFSQDRDCELFRERLGKILELKKEKYMELLEYSEEIKSRVKRVLEAKEKNMLDKMIKKKFILDKMKEINIINSEDREIKALINELYDIEKAIIQMNQDQFNELIGLIKPKDALLYIIMDRRFDHEMRDRHRGPDRRRPKP